MRLNCIGSSSVGNCLVLWDEAENAILLDCGMKPFEALKTIGAKARFMRFGLLTHAHLDHSYYTHYWLAKGMTVYMPPRKKNKDGEEIGCKAFFQEENAVAVEPLKMIQHIRKYGAGGTGYKRELIAEFIPFEVPHDGVLCYSYIINFQNHRILYMTDAEYCPYDLRRFHLTDICVECNYIDGTVDKSLPYYKHKLFGHMSFEACRDFLKRIVDADKEHCLNNVILVHTNSELDKEYVKKELQTFIPCPLYIAEPGMSIPLRTDGVPFGEEK